MTEEDKKLLLRDLSARLSYGVKIQSYNYEEDIETIETLQGIDSDGYISTLECDTLKNIYKPYLFPLSSMTDEQGKELEKIDPEFYSLICENGNIYVSMDVHGYDWLNKNHFDYRGLIPIGLANDATGLNIY